MQVPLSANHFLLIQLFMSRAGATCRGAVNTDKQGFAEEAGVCRKACQLELLSATSKKGRHFLAQLIVALKHVHTQGFKPV